MPIIARCLYYNQTVSKGIIQHRILSIIQIATPSNIQPDTCSEMVNTDCEPISALGIGQVTVRDDKGDSSVFVLSRTGHFGYSSIHNSVNIIGRAFMLHLHGSCHICVSMCDQHFFVNNFNWLIYP